MAAESLPKQQDYSVSMLSLVESTTSPLRDFGRDQRESVEAVYYVCVSICVCVCVCACECTCGKEVWIKS